MRTYEQACNENALTSDIYLHLPILHQYASECLSVTEIGLGTTANSVLAFLKGCKNVTSIDIDPMPKVVASVKEYAESIGSNWNFICKDSRLEPIEETDFLFIDGEHSYRAVKRELELHAPQVRRYIGFHDVVSFASRNENPNEIGSKFIEGIVPAIFEFLVQNPWWRIDYYSPYCNGLLILRDENS